MENESEVLNIVEIATKQDEVAGFVDELGRRHVLMKLKPHQKIVQIDDKTWEVMPRH